MDKEQKAYETWKKCEKSWCEGNLIFCYDSRPNAGTIWYICKKCTDVFKYDLTKHEMKLVRDWEDIPLGRECKKILQESNYIKLENGN